VIIGEPFLTWRQTLQEATDLKNKIFIPLRSALFRHVAEAKRSTHWEYTLLRAEDRLVQYWDMMSSQALDRKEEMKQICESGCAEKRIGSVNGSDFDAQMERTFNIVVDVLNALGVEFWPTGGTLIGALRYGLLAGHLTDGKIDSTDDDLEFMIGVQEEDTWPRLAGQIETRLLRKGLQACYLQISEPSDKYRHRLRPDTLTCGSFQPYSIAVELRSYIVQDGFAFQHTLRDVPGCAKNTRPLPLLCFTYELPYFQHWHGKLPLRLVYPFTNCLLFQRTVPCPARPIEFLLGWNGGEYDLSGYCLAVPLLTQDRTPRDPRNVDLAERGLSSNDLTLLQDRARQMHSMGFASFWPQWSSGVCPSLHVLQHRWSHGMCPPATARAQDLM